MANATTSSLVIKASNFPVFQKRYTRLVRKAAKLNIAAPSFEISERELRPLRPAKFPGEVIPKEEYLTIAVDGAEAVHVPGFSFVATVEPSPVSGVNFIHHVPGVDAGDLSEFRTSDLRCDHCNTFRQRKSIFIIQDEETAQKFVVGRSCLSDFLHIPSALDLAGFVSALADFEGEDFSGGRSEYAFETIGLISLTQAVIDRWGWTAASRETERDQSTRGIVLDAIFGRGRFDSNMSRFGDIAEEVPVPTASQIEKAEAAVAWIRSVSADPTITRNDYILNLRLALEADAVAIKQVGLAVSLLGAHTRAMADEAEKTAKAEEKAAALPVPTSEGRVEVVGEVVSAKIRYSDFGEQLKIVVKHEDGWKVWGSCPSAFLGDTVVGKTVRFNARIERSTDDETFGFFNRPTKAAYVTAS